MAYGLAMIDVDGTLRAPDDWKPGALALLDAVAASGTPIALCSGRPFASLRLLAEERREVAYVAAGGGTYVARRDGDEWTVLAERRLPPGLVGQVCARARELRMEVWAYAADEWYITTRTPLVESEIGITGAHPVVAEFDGREDVVKLLAFPKTPEHAAYLRDVEALDGLAVVESYPGYHDIIPAVGLETKGGDVLTEALGVGWDDVLAIGDGPNDVGMLSRAGTAVLLAPMEVAMLAGESRDGVTSELVRHEVTGLVGLPERLAGLTPS